MSRIGRQPIAVPDSVSIALSPGRVQANGPLGELVQNVPVRMSLEQRDGEIEAEFDGLPEAYLAKLLKALVRAGVLASSSSSCIALPSASRSCCSGSRSGPASERSFPTESVLMSGEAPSASLRCSQPSAP